MLFFAATILIASIGRTKATALRLTPLPAATDGGLFSFWLVDLMLAAVAFAGTTSLLFFCAKRSKEGTTPPPKGCAESREAEPGPEPEPEPIVPPTTDDNPARHLSRTCSYDQAIAMTAAMIPAPESQQGATPPPPLIDYAKRKVLCDLDLFVLDNSLRESTVGQTHGHLLEDKLAIMDAIASVGVKHKIIGAFSSKRQVDDELATTLRARGDDMSTTYGFTEDADTTESGAMLFGPDHIPAGLRKMAALGIQNPIIEIDFDDTTIAWDDAFPVAKLVQLVEFELTYARDAMGCSGGAFINVRDFPFAMMHCPERLLEFVQAVAKFPDGIRPMGIMVEEPTGIFFASECGKWTQWMREVAMAGWQGAKLLVHVHNQWGFGDAATMEMLANGSDGIWCSLAEEGAAMGHACATVTIANLARIGNRHVTHKFNCHNLAKAAVIVTRRTTGKPPGPRQIVYGPRAVETVFDFAGISGGLPDVNGDGDGKITEANAFNLADFFGLAKAPVRITLLADTKLVIERLRQCFGDDAQFNEALAARMLQRMQDDVLNGIKEEYSSEAGLAKLSIDAGAQATEAMLTAERKTVIPPKSEKLLKKAHRCFQAAAGPEHPDSMQARTFYETFLQPFLGCFSCDTTQVMMNSILDVNHDGEIEWPEWEFWLLWAVREYDEELLNVDDLHHCVFRNALLPTTLHRANTVAAAERKALHPHTGEELHHAKLSDPFASRKYLVDNVKRSSGLSMATAPHGAKRHSFLVTQAPPLHPPRIHSASTP